MNEWFLRYHLSRGKDSRVKIRILSLPWLCASKMLHFCQYFSYLSFIRRRYTSWSLRSSTQVRLYVLQTTARSAFKWYRKLFCVLWFFSLLRELYIQKFCSTISLIWICDFGGCMNIMYPIHDKWCDMHARFRFFLIHFYLTYRMTFKHRKEFWKQDPLNRKQKLWKINSLWC